MRRNAVRYRMDSFSSIRDLLGRLLPPAPVPEGATVAPTEVGTGIAALDAESGG